MRKKRFVGLLLLVAMLLGLTTGCGKWQTEPDKLTDEVTNAGYSNVTSISEDDRVSVVTADAGKCKLKITRKNTGLSSHTNMYTVEYVESDTKTVPLKEKSEALLNVADAKPILLKKGCGEKK